MRDRYVTVVVKRNEGNGKSLVRGQHWHEFNSSQALVNL